MDIFNGLAKAEVYGSGSYLSPDGEYVLELDTMIYKDIEAGGSALILEWLVVESNNPKDPVGCKRSWFQKKNQSFNSAVIEVLFALTGTDHKNDKARAEKVQANSSALMTKALQEQAFKGKQVRCSTSSKVTKEKKVNFTRHSWGPYVAPVAETPATLP